ncbi:MAG TPA: ACP S-malonyltransferase [Dehalococcoidia bacterium]|nr:ACP S-malonyltransferase [Dehalococcoidia bacterium]
MLEDIRVAYVFPGQESYSVGMGLDLYVHYVSARKVFEEVDKILGFPLSRLCFEGPESELMQTVNIQPAVLTASIACLKAAQEIVGTSLPPPTFVAGHSLGEFTALVAGDVLKMADAVKLVRERGRLMHEAARRKPGGMLTISGLDVQTIENICLSVGCFVSCINSPGHIVISGSQDNLNKAKRLAQIKGARRMTPLKVSGAFHSSLMEPALEGLMSAVSGFTYSKPTVPLIANVTAQPITNFETIQEELVSQLIHTVKWQQSIETMISKGVTTFFELGPGDNLANYIKGISPGARVFSVNNINTIAEISSWRKNL